MLNALLRMRTLALCLVALLAASCRHARPEADELLSEMQPRYHPTAAAAQRAPPCAAVSRLTVRELHQPANVLGSRWSEDNPKEKETVTVDVVALGAWAQDGVDRSLGRAQLGTHTPDKPEMRVRVTRLSVDEKSAFNSEYDAFISLELAIHRLGSPDPCWTGRAEGTGHTYGSSGSVENYDEALSRALDDAISKLTAMDGFYDALCDHCPG